MGVKRDLGNHEGSLSAADEKRMDELISFIDAANAKAQEVYGCEKFVPAIAGPELNLVIGEPSTFYSALIATASMAVNSEAPVLVLGVMPDGQHTTALVTFGLPESVAALWFLRNTEKPHPFIGGIIKSVAVNAAIIAASMAQAEASLGQEH